MNALQRDAAERELSLATPGTIRPVRAYDDGTVRFEGQRTSPITGATLGTVSVRIRPDGSVVGRPRNI